MDDEDFTLLELELIRIAQSQSDVQRRIGIICVQIYKKSISFERQRHKAIEEGLKVYKDQYSPGAVESPTTDSS